MPSSLSFSTIYFIVVGTRLHSSCCGALSALGGPLFPDIFVALASSKRAIRSEQLTGLDTLIDLHSAVLSLSTPLFRTLVNKYKHRQRTQRS
jgi:hypothetical protein